MTKEKFVVVLRK